MNTKELCLAALSPCEAAGMHCGQKTWSLRMMQHGDYVVQLNIAYEYRTVIIGKRLYNY